MKALTIYWSGTGNTKKVAETIHDTLRGSGVDSTLKLVGEMDDEDLYEYELVCIGSPSYMWQPPAPVQEYIKRKMDQYSKAGRIQNCAPKLPDKRGVVFVTYSGPHTGINEAIPVGKYLGQFFEHLGFALVGEWYVIGEYHGREDRSTKGKLGDIRGRPNEQDLDTIAESVKELLEEVR